MKQISKIAMREKQEKQKKQNNKEEKEINTEMKAKMQKKIKPKTKKENKFKQFTKELLWKLVCWFFATKKKIKFILDHRLNKRKRLQSSIDSICIESKRKGEIKKPKKLDLDFVYYENLASGKNKLYKLKTKLTRKLKPFLQIHWKKALSVILVIAVISSSIVFFRNSGNVQADYVNNVNQADWSGGADTNAVITGSTKDGWSRYYEKDAEVIAGEGIALQSSLSQVIDTSDVDFNLGTFDQVSVAGAGVDASLVLEDAGLEAVNVATGEYHSCALMADRTVKCWGSNSKGQLGDNSINDSFTPVSVIGISTAVAITAGSKHTCVLLVDKTIKCWGNNGNGQLGNNSTIDSSVPVNVSGISNANLVAASSSAHTCAVLDGGGVKCWGYNANGQIGDGTVGTNRLTPVNVSGISTATSVVGGYYHSCALLSDGAVKCWGRNTNGQLGNNSTTQSLTPVNVNNISTASNITTGGDHLCALLSDKTIKCWGRNSDGQLGDNSVTQSLIPVSVEGISTASSLSAGNNYTCSILDDNSVKCWGQNTYGQLGDGTSGTNRLVPVSVSNISTASIIATGGIHSCALLTDNTIKCWGYNVYGQLGNNSNTQSLSPVSVDDISTASTIAARKDFSCAVLDDGTVKCWGLNNYGQLGNNSTTNAPTPVIVEGISTATEVVNGLTHSCALLADGTVKCWGYNNHGQLGDNSTTQSPVPVSVSDISTATAVAAGDYHSCAILSGGTVKCWGYGNNGQLGDGTAGADRLAPVSVSGISTATTVTAGYGHSCVLLSDKTIKCWGYNFYGQLGDNSTIQRVAPVSVSGISTATSVATKNYHTCASLTDGTVKCWGSNAQGQMGNGTIGAGTNRITPTLVNDISTATSVVTGDHNSCATLNDGTIKCWGYNISGQLGNGLLTNALTPVFVNGISSATAVAAGYFHTCAILTNGSIKCWGSNNYGQLGSSDVYSNESFFAPNISVSGLGGRFLNGLYTSDIINTTTNGIFNQFDLTSVIPAGNSAKFYARSGNQANLSDAMAMDNCLALDSSNPKDSNCVNDGDDYFQYRLELRSDSVLETPIVEEVVLSSGLASTSASLVSSKFDTESNATSIGGLTWDEDATLPAGSEVAIALRTAGTEAGIDSAEWATIGTSTPSSLTAGCTKTDTKITCDASTIPVSMKTGGDDIWFQYKVTITAGAVSPTITNVNPIYEQDVVAPTITSITSATTNGEYGTGDTIDVTVNFSEDVISATGLVLSLDTGGSINIPAWSTPANSATGTYTIGAGQSSNDLNVTSVVGDITDQPANSLALASVTIPFTNEGDYILENLATATSLTPSATSGDITLTLGSANWNDIAKAKKGTRIIGNGGVATISEDPTASSTISATVTDDFNDGNSISSGNWQLVGVRISENLSLSEMAGDLDSWTQQDIDTGISGQTINSLIYDNINSKYIAAGYDTDVDGLSATDAVIWESTNLINWTQRNVDVGLINQRITSILHDSANSKYIAAGHDYNLNGSSSNDAVIWESTDLVNWTQRNVDVGASYQLINSIIYDSTNSKYIAAGHSTNLNGSSSSDAVIWESTDLVNWTQRNVDMGLNNQIIHSVIYDSANSKYIAAGYDYNVSSSSLNDAVIWESTDLINWTQRNVDVGASYQQISSIIYDSDNAKYIATGHDKDVNGSSGTDAVIWESTNLINWTQRNVDVGLNSQQLFSIIYESVNAKYIAVGYDTDLNGSSALDAVIWESTDLVNWTQRNVNMGLNNQIIHSVIYDSANSKYIVAGYSTDESGSSALDAVIWEASLSGTYSNGGSYYTTTSATSQINTSAWKEVQGVTLTQTTPTGTDIKYLVSFDNRATWKYWNGTSWETSGLESIEIVGMDKTSLEELSVANWEETGGFVPGTLDFAVSLSTADSSVTPRLNAIGVLQLEPDTVYTNTTTNPSHTTSNLAQNAQLVVDTTAPASVVTTPNGTTEEYFQINSLTGTASDNRTLEKVEVSIQDTNTGNYWTGSEWGAETWLLSTGTTSWNYNSASVNWTVDNHFTVKSRATDLAGNVETPTAGKSFMFVNSAPVVTVNSATKTGNLVEVNYDVSDIESPSTTVYLAYDSGATLANNMDDASTASIQVSDGSNFPAEGSILVKHEAGTITRYEHISYTSKNGNYLEGITRGTENTLAYSHAAGATISIKANTLTGDTGMVSNGNGKTLVWDAKADTSFNSSAQKVSIVANDGASANKIGINTSTAFSFDTTTPVITDASIDASTVPAKLGFEATDNDGIQMMISPNPDFADAVWENYSATKDFTIGQSVTTVYVKFKDSQDNITVTQELTTPEIPQSLMLQDVSSISQNKWRLYLSWQIVSAPANGFEAYRIYRATSENGEYVYQGSSAQGDITLDYYADTVNQDDSYYYKLAAEDQAGNISNLSNYVWGIANATQDGGEGGGGGEEPDTVSPIISAVTVSNITNSSATITWTTDENADSFVEYGLTTAYGNIFGDANLSTNHSITLPEDLSGSTTYYFRIRSRDAAGNLSLSNDETFTTEEGNDTTAPTISEVSIGTPDSTSVTISWTTDENGNSLVDFGTTQGVYTLTQGNSEDETTTHEVTLTSLNPATTYYFQVKSKDITGNEGRNDNSGIGYSFVTADSADPGDITAPTITDVTVSALDYSEAAITWTTDEDADSVVGYSTTDGVYTQEKGETSLTQNHSITLKALDTQTTYFFQVKSRDAAGNLKTDNGGYTFTTHAEPVDEDDDTAPVISEITVSDITYKTAMVSWTTDENSNSSVDYGLTVNFGESYGDNNKLATKHSVILPNLEPLTTYYFKVRSRDANGNESIQAEDLAGENLFFTTLPTSQDADADGEGDKLKDISTDVKALIDEFDYSEEDVQASLAGLYSVTSSGPSAEITNNTTATITWNTSKNADGKVYYWQDGNNEASATSAGEVGEATTQHEVIIKNLSAQTKFNYYVVSTGLLGSEFKSDNETFTTGDTPSISGINVGDITLDSATISWTTDSITSLKVEYGTSSNYSNEISSNSSTSEQEHMIKLEGLQTGQIYHFRVTGIDADEEEVSSNDYSFITLELPQISAVSINEITSERAVITWATNTKTDSSVEYRLKGVENGTSQGKLEAVTEHEIILEDLVPGTDYEFRVHSKDSFGNKSESDFQGFSTPDDSDPPTINSVKSEATVFPNKETKVQTFISWSTDKPTSSVVLYKEGRIDSNDGIEEKILDPSVDEFNGWKIQRKDENSFNHVFVFTDFNPSSIYYFKVANIDKRGNVSISDNYSLLTPVKKKSIFDLIISNFEETFGWVKEM